VQHAVVAARVDRHRGARARDGGGFEARIDFALAARMEDGRVLARRS
jgi:hypothetical protein